MPEDAVGQAHPGPRSVGVCREFCTVPRGDDVSRVPARLCACGTAARGAGRGALHGQRPREGSRGRTGAPLVRVRDAARGRRQLPLEQRETLFSVGLLRFVGCTATASQMAAALGHEITVSAAFADADTQQQPPTCCAARSCLVSSAPVCVWPWFPPARLRHGPRARGHQLPGRAVRGDRAGLSVRRRHGAGPGLREVRTAQAPRPNLGRELTTAVRRSRSSRTPPTCCLEVAAPRRRSPGLQSSRSWRARPALGRQVGSLLELLPRARLHGRPARARAAPPPVHPLSGGGSRRHWPVRVAGRCQVAVLPRPQHPRRRPRRGGCPACRAIHAEDTARVRHAALVHDVGKVAVSLARVRLHGSALDAESEQVRLHPYYTQRVLARVPRWPSSPTCQLPPRARDGSGYHRGTSPSALTALPPCSPQPTASSPRPRSAPTARRGARQSAANCCCARST